MSAGQGTTVTISGSNFTGATSVSFGGIAASSFSVLNATTITAVVSSGNSGEIKIITPAGTTTMAGFTFSLGATTLTNISQTVGSLGSTIILTGTNFLGATAVTFGGVTASFSITDNTSIKASLSDGASGEVKVTTPQGTASLTGFSYVPHSLTSAKLPETQLNNGVGIGFPRRPFRQKTSGTVKVAVILVDFSDAPATRTPQSVFNLVSPSSETFLNTISYGNLTMVLEPKLTWYRMSKPSSSYVSTAGTFTTGGMHRDYIQEAVNLADAEVDFSQSDQLLILTNPDASSIANGPAMVGNSTFGVTVDSKLFTNAVTSGKDLLYWSSVNAIWFPHEFGHSMGLPDLYAYSGANGSRFVGQFSMMGNIAGFAPDYSAWEKWLLGWISDSQVRSVNVKGPGSVQLTPLSSKGGLKFLIIPIDATSAILVEDRRASGYDNKLPKEGPVVYLIDTKLASGNGVLKVLPLSDTDEVKAQAPLSVGQSLTYGTVTVRCTASAAGGSTIEYELR